MTGSSTHNDGDDANGGGGGKDICSGDAGNNSIKPEKLVNSSSIKNSITMRKILRVYVLT
jgi:hypothetical protein